MPLTKRSRTATRVAPLPVLPTQRLDYCLTWPDAHIRPVEGSEIDRALALLLAEEHGKAEDTGHKIESFKQLAHQEHYDLTRGIVAFAGKTMIHAALFVPQAGNTAFIYTSPPAQAAETLTELPNLATKTLQYACRWAFNEGSSLLQILLDTKDNSRIRLCLQSGFTHLTDLNYMFRSVEPDDLAEPFLPTGLNWLCYQPRHHELFKNTIEKTYHGSLDCPELENLRTGDDIIAGHMAVGDFDQRWWKLLMRDGLPIGMLLLSPLRSSNTMELVYMGLCSKSRGFGLGRLILAEAIDCVRRCGLDSLVLAVDSRNQPAYHIYTQVGMRTVVKRAVLICSDNNM